MFKVPLIALVLLSSITASHALASTHSKKYLCDVNNGLQFDLLLLRSEVLPGVDTGLEAHMVVHPDEYAASVAISFGQPPWKKQTFQFFKIHFPTTSGHTFRLDLMSGNLEDMPNDLFGTFTEDSEDANNVICYYA